MQQTTKRAPLPSLADSVGATAWVLGLPVVAVVFAEVVADPSPPAAGALAMGASAVAAVSATRWWRNRSRSAAGALSDLLLWSWLRRLRASRTVEHGEDLLVESDAGGGVDVRLLESLAGALEILDPYTHGHSQRVERLVRRTASVLPQGLSEQQIDHLCRAAVLHDIGKMHVPADVLGKRGPLTDDELAAMKEHAVVGARLVSNVGEPTITEAVLHHHEAWDGSGYPAGLSAEAIPLFARIIAVADAYDAMVSARPYRASLGRETAVRTLQEEAGRQFDPRIVASFLSVLSVPARLPALIPSLAILQRAASDALGWARRTGASTLAPTAGSCAAAAVLSTALLVSPPGVRDLIEGRPEAARTITGGAPAHASDNRPAVRSAPNHADPHETSSPRGGNPVVAHGDDLTRAPSDTGAPAEPESVVPVDPPGGAEPNHPAPEPDGPEPDAPDNPEPDEPDVPAPDEPDVPEPDEPDVPAPDDYPEPDAPDEAPEPDAPDEAPEPGAPGWDDPAEPPADGPGSWAPDESHGSKPWDCERDDHS